MTDSAVRSSGSGLHRPARRRRRAAQGERRRSVTMRELGKLTADEVNSIDEPIPITNHGLPVAWLVPLTSTERRRAELIAAGRLRPARSPGLSRWSPLPPVTDEPALSELLLQMRAQERT